MLTVDIVSKEVDVLIGKELKEVGVVGFVVLVSSLGVGVGVASATVGVGKVAVKVVDKGGITGNVLGTKEVVVEDSEKEVNTLAVTGTLLEITEGVVAGKVLGVADVKSPQSLALDVVPLSKFPQSSLDS